MNYREKNTKIVATISDMRCQPEFLAQLYNYGMDVVRINTAHQEPETAVSVVQNARSVNEKIPILVDTKGPEIRTTHVESPIQVEVGQEIRLVGDQARDGEFQVSYPQITQDISVGQIILLEDGYMQLSVIGKDERALICRADNNGVIKNKKNVNFPGAKMKLPSLSEKDRSFLKLVADLKIEFVAHSFVRCKQDVLDVQAELNKLGSDAKIIAKIENREGYDNIDEILDATYGIMIARGDLGLEVPASEVPLIQKTLIKKCLLRAKPVIVATQMLESMIKNPRATRAEISDVANAILDGTSAIMLSGETAYGDYPLEAVRTMSQVSLQLKDRQVKPSELLFEKDSHDIQTVLAESAAIVAMRLNVKAFVVPTKHGKTANLLSAYRVRKPIYAMCHDPTVARRLALSYSVRPYIIPAQTSIDAMIASALTPLLNEGHLQPHDLIIFIGGLASQTSKGANFMEIDTVENLLKL